MTTNAELKRLAERATHRSWAAFTDDSGHRPHTNLVSFVPVTDCALSIPGVDKRDPNVAYIAAAYPARIIALVDEVERLRGAGWQDISTAPKDGTWFSAWRAPPSWTGPTWEPLIYVRWDDDEESWVWPCDTFQVFTVRGRELADMEIEEGDFFTSDDFTHWQPLPAPPTLTTGEGE